MKTLGELKLGDTFYTIDWEAGHVYNVQPHTVAILTDIAIGKIIKWVDSHGDLHGRTLQESEYNSLDVTSAYCESICVDLEHVKELVNIDYEKFTSNYNRILNELNNENKS